MYSRTIFIFVCQAHCKNVFTICSIVISSRKSNSFETRSMFFVSFNIDIIYMTFRKLTDQDKIKLEEFKQKHGSTNLGSYRALLMRGTDPNQAIEIINKRSSLQPIAEAPPKAQPKKRTAKKEEPAPAVEPEPVPMAIEDVKAPAP